jgi:hypothetical protein
MYKYGVTTIQVLNQVIYVSKVYHTKVTLQMVLTTTLPSSSSSLHIAMIDIR